MVAYFGENIEKRCQMREKVKLACTVCDQRNYDTTKNKNNNTERLELNKYCRFCKNHTPHKETR